MMTEANDGTGQAQGRTRQEGQARRQEVPLTIFEELAFGREHLFTMDELCIICSTPDGEAHAGRRHAFAPPGQPVDTSQFAPKRRNTHAEGDDASTHAQMPVSVSQTPFDPALRLVLIQKGIVTSAELAEAMLTISATTMQVTEGKPNG